MGDPRGRRRHLRHSRQGSSPLDPRGRRDRLTLRHHGDGWMRWEGTFEACCHLLSELEIEVMSKSPFLSCWYCWCIVLYCIVLCCIGRTWARLERLEQTFSSSLPGSFCIRLFNPCEPLLHVPLKGPLLLLLVV